MLYSHLLVLLSSLFSVLCSVCSLWFTEISCGFCALAAEPQQPSLLICHAVPVLISHEMTNKPVPLPPPVTLLATHRAINRDICTYAHILDTHTATHTLAHTHSLVALIARMQQWLFNNPTGIWSHWLPTRSFPTVCILLNYTTNAGEEGEKEKWETGTMRGGDSCSSWLHLNVASWQRTWPCSVGDNNIMCRGKVFSKQKGFYRNNLITFMLRDSDKERERGREGGKESASNSVMGIG